MQKKMLLFFTVLLLPGCLERAETRTSVGPAKSLCKVYFGSGDDQFILVGRTADSLLIYRDGKIDSSPDSYPMPKNRLGTETKIPPFEFDGVSYSITGCNEFKDDEPSSRHLLMIYVKVEDGSCTFKQYCDVTIKTEHSSLEIARFDGKLTIAPQTTNYVSAPLIFNLGGQPTDVRVCTGTINQAVGCWTVVSVQNGDKCAFANNVRPKLIVDFPAIEGTTVTKSYTLDDFC